MKQFFSASAICLLSVLLFCCGCRHHNRVSLAISESDTKYKIVAYFQEKQTIKVDRCLNKYLTGRNNMSFVNTRIDGQMTLDDRTTFYMKKYPGMLKIDFNKANNPAHSYSDMKAFAAGLRAELK